jgi:hypothetical protein
MQYAIGSRQLGAGNWKQAIGSRQLEAGNWKQAIGSRQLGFEVGINKFK